MLHDRDNFFRTGGRPCQKKLGGLGTRVISSAFVCSIFSKDYYIVQDCLSFLYSRSTGMSPIDMTLTDIILLGIELPFGAVYGSS